MAQKFFIDQDSGRFVVGPTDSNALPVVSWKNKDQFALELYFLRQTGVFGRPFSFENRSTATISIGLGLLASVASVTATGFSNLPTIVTATVTTTTAGSSTTPEVQKIAFSPKPSGGVWAINVPADSRSVTATVTAGVFITTANHGFVVGEPVTFTGVTVSGLTTGATHYVYDISSPDRFRVSVTINGAPITTNGTANGTVACPARTTALLNAYAEPAEVQSALRDLDVIGSNGVEVKGISGESFYISAVGNRQNSNFPEITVSTGNLLAPFGKTGAFNLSVAGLQTILDAESDDEVDLILEIEATDTGSIRESYATKIKVVEDLI